MPPYPGLRATARAALRGWLAVTAGALVFGTCAVLVGPRPVPEVGVAFKGRSVRRYEEDLEDRGRALRQEFERLRFQRLEESRRRGPREFFEAGHGPPVPDPRVTSQGSSEMSSLLKKVSDIDGYFTAQRNALAVSWEVVLMLLAGAFLLTKVSSAPPAPGPTAGEAAARREYLRNHKLEYIGIFVGYLSSFFMLIGGSAVVLGLFGALGYRLCYSVFWYRFSEAAEFWPFGLSFPPVYVVVICSVILYCFLMYRFRKPRPEPGRAAPPS